jgi:nitrogen fixation protein FixH
MKNKFHWGIGVAIFYAIFFVFLVARVTFSLFQHNDLVEDDYYKKELSYQKKINALKRTQDLEIGIKIFQSGEGLVFKFPDSFNKTDIKGEIHLYKPSDALMDKRYNLILSDGNLFFINSQKIEKGYWLIKVDWSVGNLNYYNEKYILIN